MQPTYNKQSGVQLSLASVRLCLILSPPLLCIKCITVVPKVDEQVTFKAHQMQTFRKSTTKYVNWVGI